MGQCTQRIIVDDYEMKLGPCPNDAVLWGTCEKHLTPRDRAVWELLQRAEYVVEHTQSNPPLDALHRAIAEVKEGR